MRIEEERRKFVKRLKKKYAKLIAENKKNLREMVLKDEWNEIRALTRRENKVFFWSW